MTHEDRHQAEDETVESQDYQAPKAEEVPSLEGPAVTTAGATLT